MITLILVILALICFVVAAFSLISSKVNLVALGLAILVLAYLLEGVTIGAKR
jgi:hypothetical protein